MSFDWGSFLDKQRIEYSDRGPSTSRNNLYIHCPFCGHADQGRHMGVSTEGRGWGCWRNQAHRGKNPQRLVQALIGCSWSEAARLVGNRVGGGLWGAADAIGEMLAGFDKIREVRKKLELPPEFRPFSGETPQMFIDYMMVRMDLSFNHVLDLADHYRLHWAITGHFAYRVIFPVRDAQGSLVTWSGRSIGDAKVRYKTLTSHPNPERPADQVSHGPITDYLLDMRQIARGGRFLIITEGPFDALNIHVGTCRWKAPVSFGVLKYPDPELDRPRVTCLFGKSVSDMQLDRLAALRDQYDAMFILLDPEASTDAFSLANTFGMVGATVYTLTGDKDPGELDQDEMNALFDDMAAKADGFAKAGRRA